jgi:protease II
LIKLNVSFHSRFLHRLQLSQKNFEHFIDHTQAGFLIVSKNKSDDCTKIYVTENESNLDLGRMEPRIVFQKGEIVTDVDILNEHLIIHLKIAGQTKLRSYSLTEDAFCSIELPETFVSILPSETQVHMLGGSLAHHSKFFGTDTAL